MMSKIKQVIAILGLIPVIIAGWGWIATAVYLVDQIEFIMETVTVDNVNSLLTKIDALWIDYEARMGVTN